MDVYCLQNDRQGTLKASCVMSLASDMAACGSSHIHTDTQDSLNSLLRHFHRT